MIILENNKYIKGLPFVLPGIVVLLLIIGVPLFSSFLYSLREVYLYRFTRQPFVGLQNYIDLFRDPLFITSTRVTIVFTLLVTIFSVCLGLLVAIVLSRKDIRGKNIFVALFLVPFVSTPVVVGILWRLFMWEPEYGLVNYFISLLGTQGPFWLTDRQTALFAVVSTNIWRLTPLALLVLYAALTMISEEIIEAAKIDGAGWLSMLFGITIPAIRYHLFFITLIIMTSAFREFDAVYSLTSGGPGRATTVLSILVYNRGITSADMGNANAVAFSMFILIAAFIVLYIRIFSKKEV